MTDNYTCPSGCDLRGDPIPEASRHLYGGAAHFSRMVGIELRGVYDGVIAWYCPDCKLTWARERFAGNPRVRQYVKEANDRGSL